VYKTTGIPIRYRPRSLIVLVIICIKVSTLVLHEDLVLHGRSNVTRSSFPGVV
jgi:hypothetical protein